MEEILKNIFDGMIISVSCMFFGYSIIKLLHLLFTDLVDMFRKEKDK